ncbi:MAG TPA: hydrogenase [Terriglobales bacterium]
MQTQLYEREVAEPICMDTLGRKLMWCGMFLFLLGLITGFFEERFTNMRMGLSAHLEGVMNGTFVVALGAIWSQVRLPRPARATAYAMVLYGTYGNWLTTTFAALFGTAANTPIAAAGHTGQPWQEGLVAAGFLSVAIAMVASVVLVLWGLWGDLSRTDGSWEQMKSTISRGAERR